MIIQKGTALSSYGVRKNLPYVRFMNYEISRLRQSGMLDVMLERYSVRQPQCSIEENLHDKISFYKLILPFSIILVGIGIAFVILGIEYLYNNSILYL